MIPNRQGEVVIMVEKRCYTVQELQDILGISRQAIYSLLKKRFFQWHRIGGKYLVSKISFDQWFDGSSVRQK